MALINHAKREINSKIVYFGPGLSGKGTNLNYIYRKLKPECRGKLKAMKVENDRMLFFDFMPFPPSSMSGYNLHLHVYTLTGETTPQSPWKMVLKGVDGIVFVADSDPAQMETNRKSIRSLQEYLSAAESGPEIPLIIQCNKADVAGARTPETIRGELASVKVPVFPAVASTGEGVVETLSAIVKLVQAKLVEQGVAEAAESSPAGGPGGPAEEPFSPPGEVAEDIAAEESPPAREAVPAPTAVPADFEAAPSEPVVEVAGAIETDGEALCVPLLIRCGTTERRFQLTVSLREER